MRIIFDAIIACLVLIMLLVVMYLAVFSLNATARAALPAACEAYPSECTAVMQGQF